MPTTRLLPLVVVVVVVVVAVVAVVVAGSPPRTDLWLLGLFPFNGTWAGGLGQYPAIQMAVHDVNADDNILAGYRLRMTVDNTQCDPGIGLNALYRRLYEKRTKLVVVGAGCSAVTEATATATHLWNLVQLSYTSASPALSDKQRFRMFYRVFPPESSFNHAKFVLLQKFGWAKVGTLTQAQEELFTLTASDFLTMAKSHGVTVTTSETFLSTPQIQIWNMKRRGVRVIIGNFYADKARLVFCEAYRQKMYGPRYVWIITGFYRREWWKNSTSTDCTDAQVEAAIQGYFTSDANPQSLSALPGISGKTYDEFAQEYSQRTKYENQTAYQEAAYGYDSVWAIASMLNRSVQYMEQHAWDRRLEDFSYNDSKMATLFLTMMNSTMFQGVSGPVMFDDNGDRKGLTQIEQLQNFREVRIAVYDPSLPPGQRTRWEPNRPVVWSGGSPPSDSISEKVVPKVISRALFLVMTILASFGVVLSCFFLVFNIRYRTRKYIKMSSPNLNNVILAGAISAFLSVIVSGIDGGVGSMALRLVMCKVYNWTLSLGFSLAFGAMFSKTWRVHKIFTNKKIQRMVIKDYQLLAIVCVLVGLDVVVLTVWEAIDPLHIALYNRTLEQMTDPQNDNQILIPQASFCESSHMWYFAGILYAIKGLLLVFGAFLAFETRKVTVPALNDSKFIGVSVYNVVVLCLIGVPIALMMKEEIDACYLIISLFVFFATTLTICVVFIPKILDRNKEPHSGSMWTKSSDATQQRTLYTTGVDDGDRREVDRLRDENDTLKFTLQQSQERLRQLESLPANGLSPTACSDEVLITADSLSMPLNEQTPQTDKYSAQHSI